MDSKKVTKEINSIIRPILKEKGFDKFSGRTYWRYKTDRIDILNFQSFNAYNAKIMGCTTFSFAVKLATLINYLPIANDIKEKNGLRRPAEYQGHFRSEIAKGIEQKKFLRKDIWLIDNDKKYLTEVVNDCKTQIEQKGFEWYKQFDNNENILRILMEDQIDMRKNWGFGNVDSPNRNKLIAYTALKLGKIELAKNKFNEFINFYKNEYDKIKGDYYSRDLANHYLQILKEGERELRNIKTTHNNGYK